MSKSSDLKEISNKKGQGQKVVFTNGCFDILHVGHLRYLQNARNQGDLLVVGLNSDNSVSTLKGPDRPIIAEKERREMLLGLKPVDFVIVFEEETPLNLIKEVEPDVLVKGGDWAVKDIVGNEEVTAAGGEVKSLNFEPGDSSTTIIKKIQSL
jgi:rfaE bifunctional protein nucleotidyltransferase chain/domain